MKSAFKSKTIWLGLAIACIPLLEWAQTLPLTPTQSSVVTTVLGLLVILNRFKTNTAIGKEEELG